MDKGGQVYAWGNAMYGKLGIGEVDEDDNVSTPTLIPFDAPVLSASAGPHNTLLIHESGISLSGCGLCQHGSSLLGTGVEKKNEPLMFGYDFGENIIQASLGNYHAAVLTESGCAYTWGWGGLGQLGNEAFDNLSSPKQLDIKCVKQVAAGTKHTIILTEFGELYSFGNNDHGQLGIGNTIAVRSPTLIKRIQDVSWIACGLSHSVAVDTKNRVWIWGQVSNGKIQTIPEEVTYFREKEIWKVACGEWNSLALSQTGQVYHWDLGEVPSPVESLTGLFIKDIAAGCFHNAAVTDSGELYTWGRNSCGQLGREGDTKTAAKVDLDGKFVIQVSCGDYHTIATVSEEPLLQKLWNIIKEERQYFNSLSLIMNHYMDASRSTFRMVSVRDWSKLEDMSTSLKKNLVPTIFSNINRIYSLHKNILRGLDDSTQGYPSFASFVNTLKEQLPKYKNYLVYSDNYSTGAVTLHNEKQENKHFRNFLREQQRSMERLYRPRGDQRSFDPLSLLISPIKHLARFTLLLKDLISFISDDSPEKFNLRYVIDRFDGILERIVLKNFSLTDPYSILNCSLDEYGQPELGSGALEIFVERATHHQVVDLEFQSAFLLTYRLFATKEDVFSVMKERYKRVIRSDIDETKMRIVSHRIFQFFVTWAREPFCSKDIRLDREFLEEIRTFVSQSENHIRRLEAALETPCVVLPPFVFPNVPPFDGKLKHDIRAWNPLLVAQYISFIDFEFYKRITHNEFLSQKWAGDNARELAPNITLFTNRFNSISQWVKWEVINPSKPKERAAVFNHLAVVAKECFTLGNFCAAGAIISALSHHTISRMKNTLSKVGQKTEASVEELAEYFRGADNFRVLRTLQANQEPPIIPFLAIALKDLTFLEDGNPNFLLDGGINFYKFRKIAQTIFETLQFQITSFPVVQECDDLEQYATIKFEEAGLLSEKDFIDLSKKRE
eukprot:TRINITY_DN878_c5_g1_i1.p1 TRINITY_DN878_c5_g1~~TRINITY_DN878_c5_g1_i1.p1  ORF type:complete len:952 (-),score=201.60 TRINITY_DN878_c5_g1_i1:52-2907(-)